MTKVNASIATIAAAVLLSGNAFAGSLQPAAGEGPFFNDVPVASSTLQRAEVRADAARHLPASGTFNAQSKVEPAANDMTRAEVRQATREAIAHGFRIASGERV